MRKLDVAGAKYRLVYAKKVGILQAGIHTLERRLNLLKTQLKRAEGTEASESLPMAPLTQGLFPAKLYHHVK